MIDRSHALPVTQQCQILSLACSTAYYRPKQANEADLALMRRIDELHMEHPFAGSRMLRDMLKHEGHRIGRKHVATLMKKMGIEGQPACTVMASVEHADDRFLHRDRAGGDTSLRLSGHFQHRPGQPVHQSRIHATAQGPRHCHQHGGRGCWRDNVFVERLWKSIKYEEVYLRAYETVSAECSGIGRYLEFYNSRRPRSAIDGDTPDAFYFANLSALEQAA